MPIFRKELAISRGNKVSARFAQTHFFFLILRRSNPEAPRAFSPVKSEISRDKRAIAPSWRKQACDLRTVWVADTLETLDSSPGCSVSDLTHRSALHYANASSIVIFIQFKPHVARLLKDTQIPPAVVAIRRFRARLNSAEPLAQHRPRDIVNALSRWFGRFQEQMDDDESMVRKSVFNPFSALLKELLLRTKAQKKCVNQIEIKTKANKAK